MELPRWPLMWILAISLYFGLKSLTLIRYAAALSARRRLSYLLLWPGMDARVFLKSAETARRPSVRAWLAPAGEFCFGLLLFSIAVLLVDRQRLLAAWIALVGLTFALPFGLFHMLSLIWQQAGVEPRPVMNKPILASSLSDFWGRRWNLAVRDLAYTYVFHPLVGRVGVAGAMFAAFLMSGLLHEVVISVSAGAGYGLPTLYFLIQAVALLAERSRLGSRIGLRSGLIARVYCGVVTAGPLGLLFHPPFLERVVIAMLEAIRSL